jgi:uncharacterized lipoprotein YajG
MRVADHQQSQMFSYLSRETEMRKAHSLRAVRFMVEEVLVQEEDDDTIPVKAL